MNFPKCPKNKYHAFDEVYEDAGGKIERCLHCGHKEVFRKNGNRIDNKRYLLTHIRDFCQPTGPTAAVFEEIYGKTAIKKIEDIAKEKGLINYRKTEKYKGYKREELQQFYRTLLKTDYT